MTSSRRLTLGAVLIIGTTALSFVFGLGIGSAGSQSAVQSGANLSILSRPATSADTLPDAVATSPAVGNHIASGATARLAATSGTERVYVSLGKLPGSVCLIEYDETDGSVATDCAPASSLVRGAIYLSDPKPDGTVRVVGIVADQYSAVSGPAGSSGTKASNNVFIIDRLQGQHVVLDGPSGKSDFDLGQQFPPGFLKSG